MDGRAYAQGRGMGEPWLRGAREGEEPRRLLNSI